MGKAEIAIHEPTVVEVAKTTQEQRTSAAKARFVVVQDVEGKLQEVQSTAVTRSARGRWRDRPRFRSCSGDYGFNSTRRLTSEMSPSPEVVAVSGRDLIRKLPSGGSPVRFVERLRLQPIFRSVA